MSEGCMNEDRACAGKDHARERWLYKKAILIKVLFPDPKRGDIH
jgi:hypothetical protein